MAARCAPLLSALLGPHGARADLSRRSEGVLGLLFAGKWCRPCEDFVAALRSCYHQASILTLDQTLDQVQIPVQAKTQTQTRTITRTKIQNQIQTRSKTRLRPRPRPEQDPGSDRTKNQTHTKI